MGARDGGSGILVWLQFLGDIGADVKFFGLELGSELRRKIAGLSW